MACASASASKSWHEGVDGFLKLWPICALCMSVQLESLLQLLRPSLHTHAMTMMYKEHLLQTCRIADAAELNTHAVFCWQLQ